MATTEKLRNKLMGKLTELFQLDQPDLDFGFYRIMHTKAQQVKTFIDQDLLQIIENAFGQVNDDEKVKLYANIQKEIEAAKDYGSPEPEKALKVMEAVAKYEALKDGATAEAEVYDHLYRFFERYYDNGDFISRRYYVRENSGKAAPFAIPYNGEEVKLHWANADQYYIKTTEYFSNYSFDITQAAEVRKMSDQEKMINGFDKPLKIHFRIVDASEGEHGNVKETEDKKRFFVLFEENPVELNAAGELVVNFEYKSQPSGKNDVDEDTENALKENYGRSLNKGDMPNLAIADKIIKTLSTIEEVEEYIDALKLEAPTEKIPKRPLLAKYINQYTARNTSDYFIHKDLNGFLKRELDFYIKNEVMHLDDIENADVPAVESYLKKLQIIRKIATKLIEFLAQLEDFQKKLWLKKKFVTETNYCITLDRIPQELYAEIMCNRQQWEEWERLGFIGNVDFNDPTNRQETNFKRLDFVCQEIEYTVEILPKPRITINNKFHKDEFPSQDTLWSEEEDFFEKYFFLIVDTAFFGDGFKAKLIASIEDFDEQCDGLLIHSENFQALNLLQERYREQVKCIYIDPPYNAKSSEILYKNSYRDSSWLSLMDSRLELAKETQTCDSVLTIAIDEVEQELLGQLLTQHYPNTFHEKSCIAVNHNPSGQQGDNFSFTHEYAYFVYPKPGRYIAEQFRENEADWDERNFRDVTGNESLRTAGANCFYPVFTKDKKIIGFGDVCPNDFHPEMNEKLDDEVIAIYPIDPEGIERKWRFARNTVERIKDELKVHHLKNRNVFDIKRLKKKFNFKSNWIDARYSANNHGTQLLNQIIPKAQASYPKSIYTVQDSIYAATNEHINSLTLDFFAGSGTTGHAVINLNREDDGKRKYILVEMGDYFDTVLKPRISKVIYSNDWKDGKPTNRNTGISHCYKYLRLESYEDTLNNLVFDENSVRDKVIASNQSLKEEYMLRYLLNIGTRGSQSLLNIDNFADPTSYTLEVKKPGSDEQVPKNIDLIETFNYLIGLRLENMAAPQIFTARFTRKPDNELPEDQDTKLVLDGRMQQINPEEMTDKTWWFRKLEGWLPADPLNPNNGEKERVLIVWRKLTGNLEEDNLMLDEWFQKYRISSRDFEYDIIYVNGSNNLPNLKKGDENWKVRLIEEEFHKKMWEAE